MPENHSEGPLQPGDRAPDFVLDAITREGKVALQDFRGQTPVLVGLFRGLHCPFCRRHMAAIAELDGALREKGIESLTVVNTPIERARLYFRYHPMPGLRLAASDPERLSHRAFGLPNVEFTENVTEWPRRIGMDVAGTMRLEMPELPEPMSPVAAAEFLNRKDGYEEMEADRRMIESGRAQLVGQFLLDRDGVVRWSFTEVPEGGRFMFGAPNSRELMSAAAAVAN